MLASVIIVSISHTLGAADRLERLRADVPVVLDPSPTVKITSHDQQVAAPSVATDQQPRTLLELFNSWVGQRGAAAADSVAPVKIEPQPPVQNLVDPPVSDNDRDATVPIDPAPKITIPQLPGLSADGTSGLPVGNPSDPEPLGVLTTQLVSTSLVATSLWGKSPVADEGPGDELDRFAAASAASLDKPSMPASRRLVERAKPPLKAGRVDANKNGDEFLTPIEPAASPPIN